MKKTHRLPHNQIHFAFIFMERMTADKIVIKATIQKTKDVAKSYEKVRRNRDSRHKTLAIPNAAPLFLSTHLIPLIGKYLDVA